jgi:arabinofuranan 3-O-arabinosyltransferase
LKWDIFGACFGDPNHATPARVKTEPTAGNPVRRRTRAIRFALLAGVAIPLLALLFTQKVSRKMPDFEVYWKAAVRARAAEPLYRAEDLHYQFKYLPAFAVLTIPAGLMPLQGAKSVWFATSVLLLVALVALSLALLPERRKPQWLLLTVILVAMLKFFAHEVVLGQINVLFAVVVLLALAALRDGREAAAGVLIAIAVVVKPYAVIFLPWLLARRRARSIVSAVAGVGAVLAVPAILYGVRGDIELHRAWWRTVTESTAPNLTNPDNVSVAAMYAKWMGAGATAAALTAITAALVLAAAAFLFLRRRDVRFPEGLEGAALLTIVPLLSPQGWDYVFLVSTPAIALLANYEDQLPGAIRPLAIAAVATIGLSLYDVMGRAAYAAFMAMSVLTVCYFVVIVALCTLRARAVV